MKTPLSTSWSRWIIRWRWPVATLVPLLAIATFILGAPKAGMETDWRVWFDPHSQEVKAYDRFQDRFGNDLQVIMLLHRDEGVFTPEALASIARVTEALWKGPYILRVDSLTNFQYAHTDPEDPDTIIVEDLVTSPEALTPEALKQIKATALNEEALIGRLLSKDTTTAMIAARMVPMHSVPPEVSKRTRDYTQTLIDREAALGFHYLSGGASVYGAEFSDAIMKNIGFFLPALILIVTLMLGVVFRRFSGAFLPIGVVFLTIPAILGGLFLMGFKLNMITAMIPLFVLAIAVADAVHIYWVYKTARQNGHDADASLESTMSKNLLPAFLTSLTTGAGFLSLAVSPVVPLQTLGYLTAMAVR